MRSRRPRPVTAAVAAATATLLGLVGVTVLVPVAPAAAAQSEDCPDPGDLPNGGNLPPLFTDTTVNVFAGGSFVSAPSAAEVEGLLVALGDVTIDRPGSSFNVGTVGVGSQIAPPPGTDMLISGGQVTVTDGTHLFVGDGSVDDDGTLVGGQIRAAGAVTAQGSGTIDTNNGAIITNDAGATADYADLPTELTSTSANLLALGGTPGAVAPGQVAFVGDDTTDLQVFTITAAQLTATREVTFANIARDAAGAFAPIVVNVTGGPTLDWSPNYFAINGVRVDGFGSADFGNAASAILWNVADATQVTLGGSSQVMGSVLVPEADSDATITASTNGRVYVGGDILMNGTGNELHSFPWRGPGPFDCVPPGPEPTAGSARLSKVVVPGSFLDGLLNANGQTVRFHGEVECDLPEGGGTYLEPFTVRAGTSLTMEGLPLGATCTVREDLSATDQGVNPDYTAVDVGDYVWQRPVVTIDGAPTSSFTVTSSTTPVAVEVTNALLGTFTVTKHVTGPAGGLLETGRTFDIGWTCSSDGFTVGDDGQGDPAAGSASGTISVSDGDTAFPTTSSGDRLYFPTSTRCTIDEDTPTGGLEPPYAWQTPTVSPSSITIGGATAADAVHAVTVTNRYVLAHVGGFTVHKVVTGDSGAATDVFAVDWSCSAANADDESSGTLQLAADGSSPVTGFPVGTTCSVTEAPPSDENGTWSTPAVAPGTLTIAEDDGTAQVVTVTNRFTSAIGAFRIEKLVADGRGSAIDTFTVAWSCDRPDADGRSSGAVTLRSGESSGELTGFPVGTTCTVSEPHVDDPAGTWSAEISGGGVLTIGSDDPSRLAVVTVTNTFEKNAPTPTPSPTAPSPSTTSPEPAASVTTPVPGPSSGAAEVPGSGGGGLAVTGFDALTIAAVGAFLLALGLAAVLIARRRRS